MRLNLRPVTLPGWIKGIIEGVDATLAPLGSLASGLNFFATPADRLAVRGGSAVVNTLHDADDTELADTLRIEPFTPVAAVVVGWSSDLSTHYAYRMTAAMAFYTGTESTSRTDLSASPSTGWNVGPARPLGVELYNHLFLVDCDATFATRQPLLAFNADGTFTMPAYTLSDAVMATGTLTADGSVLSDGNTVTLGSVTYTFKTSVSVTANQVALGSSAEDSLTNLSAAVNASGVPGTQYGSATVQHPLIGAGDINTAASPVITLLFTARYGGTDGNSLATTETSGHLSFGATTLTGGSGSNPLPLYPLVAEEYNNVLFIAGYGDEAAQDAPQRVRHSFLGQDPADPVTGFNGLAYNDIGATGIPVKALVKGRGILLAVKDNELWRITGFGNASPGWQYQVELVNNTFGYGVSNPWAMCFAEDYWYGWGNNGPFRTDGYVVESLRGPREFSWRLLNEFDQYFVEYHADRRVVCFGVHPAQTDGDRSTTVPYVLWVWDVVRQVWQPNQMFGNSAHSPDFGAGFDLNHIKSLNVTTVAGPTGPPRIEAVTSVGLTGFTANWDNGDTTASTEVWVSQATGPFTLNGTAAVPGATSQAVGSWTPGNAYSVQVRHNKNGVVTAFSAVTGWIPAPFPAPNPPAAITGATSIDAESAVYDRVTNEQLSPAQVSFVCVQALDTLTLYDNGVSLQVWSTVVAGFTVTDFEIPGAQGFEHDLQFKAQRANYTEIDSAIYPVTT